MKAKTILCSVAMASMMAGLASCSSEEPINVPSQPQQSAIDWSTSDVLSLRIGMPGNDLKTRAGETPTFSYGEDGLWKFDRTIDRLYYAVYKDGNLLYHSEQPGVNQATYDATDEDFKLDIQIPRIDGDIKLEDYSVFFFAANALDKVDTKEISDGIGLDFANKTMYAYPTVMNKTVANGNYFDPQQKDYFAKYTTLDKVCSGTEGSVTLIRPFCQVSLLTDELCQAGVLHTYASDGKVALTTSPSVQSQKSTTFAKTLPYAWNYGTDAIMTKNASTLALSLKANAYDNSSNGYTIPQEVTFKSRKMFCIASYLMLAPSTKKAYDANADKDQFFFDLNATGNVAQTDASKGADIPAGGFKANEKYVMYNKAYDPSTGEGGEGGIFSSHYLIDVYVDPTWDNSNDLGF